MTQLDRIKDSFHKIPSMIDTAVVIILNLIAIIAVLIVLIAFVSIIYKSNTILGIIAGVVCFSIAWAIARWGI